MRKMMVFLLVTGILLGMLVIEDVCEKIVNARSSSVPCEYEPVSGRSATSEFNPVTCSGEGGGGSGGGVPG